MHTTQKPTLILGGTGKTGRRVAARLTQRGIPVRIGSRSANPPFDWGRADTWADVLKDVIAAYVVYAPDLAFPGASDSIRAFGKQAVDQGVQRLVLLSGRGEEGALAGERAIQDSGAAWTILRASWFAQIFTESLLLEPVRSGHVAFPAAEVAEPFIDAEDIADLAAAALTGPEHVGQVYEVTGPRLLTFGQAVGEIAKATGRDIRYSPLSLTEYTKSLIEIGLPPDEAAGLTEVFSTVLDGRNASLSDGIQRGLGREPRDFAQFARSAAAAGTWN